MTYDITFIGHMCFDEVIPFQGQASVAPGSAVMCGAMAAARVGRKVAVVAKMAKADGNILQPLRDAGVDTFLIPGPETSYMQVIHPSADVDVRRMFHRKNAGFIAIDEVPELKTARMHLAGISDREFTIGLVRGLRARGCSLSVDMQSFVRQVDPDTREVFFRDVPDKEEIAGMVNSVKLDVVEAKLLTGHDDLERAAMCFEAWGCPEIVITESNGVLARVAGRTYYERFSNTTVAGRTGRGDTAFAGYLAWRIDHGADESLKFAAALASVKMETPGPFAGTLEGVLARMEAKHS